jgi:hypothetical protein
MKHFNACSRYFALACALLALTACGGGGGGSESQSSGNNNSNSDNDSTPDTPPAVVYVSDIDGDDDFDGLSPASARKTIAAGLTLAAEGTGIRVAEGSYPISERIELKPGVSLLGGYARDFDTRDPAANETVIESDNGAFVSDDADIGNDSLIDGFVVESNAFTSGKVDIEIAAGSPTIQNNVIRGEDDGTDWTAIRVSGGSPLLLDNVINGIRTGIEVTQEAGSPVIRGNAVIDGAGSLPFGIYLDAGTDVVIDNNTIYGGDSDGTLVFAGIWVTGATSVNITNNTIDGGRSAGGTDSETNGIRVAGGWAGIRNNVIYGGDGGESSVGIMVSGSAWMDNNTIDGGSGSLRSSGVSIIDSEHASLRNNLMMATSGGSANYCVYDNNTAPDAVQNNNFFDCTDAAYYEAAGSCANDEDSDGDNNTCPVSEMENLPDIGEASGNVALAPVFADADGTDGDATTLADNNYRLTGSSPPEIIEGGLDLSEDLTTDKDGEARTATIANNPANAGAAGWSMGAFEFH